MRALTLALIVALATLLVSPANAGEGLSFEEFVTGQPGGLFLAPGREDPGPYDLEYVRTVPPMTPEQRTAFDSKMQRYHHADCNCYRFLKNGRLRELYGRPSTDYQRWLVTRAMGFGWLIPVVSED